MSSSEYVVPLAGLGPAAEHDGAEHVSSVEEESPPGMRRSRRARVMQGVAEVMGAEGEEEIGEGL